MGARACARSLTRSLAKPNRHLGLLSLARHHDIRTAYALLADPEALAAAAEPPPGDASSAELLAVTRLDAGLHPDLSEAHLRHALAALDQSRLDEADASGT